MNLFFGNEYFKQYSLYAFRILLLAFALTSCDSPDSVHTQQVDSSLRISDSDLLWQEPQPKQQNTYYFGFDLRASPQEDAAQYLPFLTYLEKSTGYHFKLHFTPKSSSTTDEMGQNKIQFAAMGATGFIKARSKSGVKSLVRGLNKLNKAEYQSVFVVSPKSEIRNIKDIRGHHLAFGSKDSTQGHLIPRIMLIENNINLNDLKSYDYTGSHQNCAEAVVSRTADVCGMQDQLAEELASQGLVKIIHRSRLYPSSGIVVSKYVPEDIIATIKQALLKFDPQGEHKQNLYHWDRTEMPHGFIEAYNSDYTNLQQWSIQLGFLAEDINQDQKQ